jgi:hypothetical protein
MALPTISKSRRWRALRPDGGLHTRNRSGYDRQHGRPGRCARAIAGQRERGVSAAVSAARLGRARPEAIWTSVEKAMARLLRKKLCKPGDIAGIGITNQRETTVLWDRRDGRPVHNAIVWQCRRTADFCASLKQAGMEKPVRQRSGLVLDPYFSASKFRWLLQEVSSARRLHKAGHLGGGHDRQLSAVATHGRAGARNGCLQCRAHLADEPQVIGGTKSCSGFSRCPPISCPQYVPVVACSAIPGACAACPTAFRLPGSPGISRRRCLDRPVLLPVMPSAPSARAHLLL